ncbi:hypothetical protein CLOM_g3247 [Closterium sp. NIES-68]|nr:hypothetical protein CLOM_g3247 [Closterium sp. NIES-68]GJP59931.1 hypothetical protein CLOP_g16175 [Closterium sp. NIES-67]GJP76397.1 hypothetical protein CLOP_g6848 [Closterium sp. NIES-67]
MASHVACRPFSANIALSEGRTVATCRQENRPPTLSPAPTWTPLRDSHVRKARATTGRCATSQRRRVVVATAFGSPWPTSAASSAGKPADSQAPGTVARLPVAAKSASGATGEPAGGAATGGAGGGGGGAATETAGAAGAVPESPPYKPGLLGPLFLAMFRRQLVEAVGWSSPKEGYAGMIEEARRLLLMHSDRKKSEEAAVIILRKLFPPFLLPLFKKYFAPLWNGRIAAVLCAWVTHFTCQWLMGPTKVVEIELEDGSKQGSGVKIEKCKFLDETSCAGSCIHTCKMPTQAFLFGDMGVPLLMEPNFEDFSCEFKFGVHAPPRDSDPVLLTPCLAICPARSSSPSPPRSSSSRSSSPQAEPTPPLCPQVQV